MKVIMKFYIMCVIAFVVSLCLSGCSEKTEKNNLDFSAVKSYRDIPGVTADEISGIESLKSKYSFLTMGTISSTEAFLKNNGEIGGYIALFCEWLSSLFDIPFKAEICLSNELIAKLDSGEIDFSGNMMSTPEREITYFMTDTIAERQFIKVRLSDSPDSEKILAERPIRYAFAADTPVEAAIAAVTEEGTYVPVTANNFAQAYQILINKEADAYIATNVAVANFIDYDNIIFEDFFPLIFNPVSMAALKKELEPVISVVTKAVRIGARSHLNDMYSQGYHDYLKHKMSIWLNDEERALINKANAMPIAAYNSNYPLCFYNSREKEWQGIYFDLLKEISSLTGLSFKVAHNEKESWPAIYKLLVNGDAVVVPELVRSHEREKLFIWSDVVILNDHYALVSRSEHRNITINEILQEKVGLARGTNHAELFKHWFPNHMDIVEYEGIDLAFNALLKGEVDMVMTTQRRLMQLTNYQEQVGYKTNIVFSQTIETRFGFNKDEVVLRSIVDKALKLIDVERIAIQWTQKTYDYRAKVAEARLPWLIGAITMTLAVVALILIILDKNRRQSVFLIQEHERVRVMLDTLPIACFIGTVDGKIFDCNSETVKLFELKDKQEFIDKFEKELSPEFQPDGKHSMELLFNYGNQAVDKGKCVFNWTHQLVDKTPIPALVTLEKVNYGKGKVVMAYIRDMREHRKMMEEIGRQNELLKAVNNVSSNLLYPDMERFGESLLMSMSIMGGAIDVDRVCIWKNHRINGRNYCALTHEWVSGRRPQLVSNYTVDVSYDDILHGWWDTLSQGGCINKLVRDMSMDERKQLDQFKIISIFITPVFVHEEFWGFVGYDDCRKERIFSDNEEIILRSAGMMFANAFIRNDMTNNIVEASIELIKAKELAEQSNRSKTIFLSQMSHEIRTPMNAILGIAEIRLRDESISPDNEEAFGKIYEAGDLLLNIINDILDLSKIESGRLELALYKYDIPSLINDTAQLNRMRYDSKPIVFTIQVDENTPVDLLGDELRIKQILNNILSNAFKYTDEGKIDFYIYAEPSEENNDEVTLVFRVSDTGQGMTREQLERLFDEYTRFNLDTNRTVVGVGLGMSITKRLVELMNGRISVESEPGKGSLFTVRIPQQRTSQAVCGRELVEKLRSFSFQSTAITKKTQFIREYMPYGSVLVVDDVESNIYVVKGMLMPYGLKIDTASSGFEAIKKIEEGNVYDIVFMDHMMPKMDGIEATKNLRSMGYHHAIVALTANALIGRAEMFLKNGFDGFLSKPIDSRELNLTLNEFIRNKKPPEVIEAARQEMQQRENLHTADTAKNDTIDDELKAGVAHDIENAFSVLEELLPQLKAGADLKLFATIVHGLKSALANINEMQLSNIALRLEQAAKNAGTAVLSAETPGFMNMLKTLLVKIKKPETHDENSQTVSDDDKKFLRDKLNEIKKACDKLVVKDAKAALSELKRKTWPSKINGIIEEITLYLVRGEYSKVASAAQKAADI